MSEPLESLGVRSYALGNVEINPGPLTNEISNTSLVNTDKSLAIYNINIRSIRNKLELQ